MITITTINNSWYFINDDFRIRPNETEVYDETTLTYRQVRDLLNAEINNRIVLSEADKEILNSRLSILDGNISESELKTINGESILGSGDISVGSSTGDPDQYLDDLGSSVHISGGNLVPTGGVNFLVEAGTGYARAEDGTLKRITWNATTSATVYPGDNYIVINSNSEIINLSANSISSNGLYVPLGYIFTNATNTTILGLSNIRLTGKDNLYRIAELFRTTLGSLVESGCSTAMQASPNQLQVTISAGKIWNSLNRYGVVETSSFNKIFKHNSGFDFDILTAPNTINNTHYNVSSNPINSCIVEMTAGFYKKDIIGLTPTGVAYYLYGTSEHATLEEAKIAPLPQVPENIKNSIVRSCAIIIQKGAPEVAELLDIRPIFQRIFEVGAAASNATVISHNDLVDLATDSHLQYLNEIRGDIRYYRKAEVDTALESKAAEDHLHSIVTNTENGFMSSSDKTKLDTIEANATVNQSDAFLRNRTNHTGTQPSSTISDFNTVVDTRIGLKIQNQINDGVVDIAPSQNAVFDSLATKSNVGHTHIISDVANLQTTLDQKASSTHTHQTTDIINFDSAVRTLAVSDEIVNGVTNKAPSQNSVFDALTAKADLNHNHTVSQITDFDISVDTRVNNRLATVNLEDIADVNTTSKSNGQVLSYNSSTNTWVAVTPASGNMTKSTYDTTDNGIIDNSERLGNNLPSFYTNRSNHTGTQDISTINNLSTTLTSKQDSLVSGTNLKTINGESLLGAGNIVASGGSVIEYNTPNSPYRRIFDDFMVASTTLNNITKYNLTTSGASLITQQSGNNPNAGSTGVLTVNLTTATTAFSHVYGLNRTLILPDMLVGEYNYYESAIKPRYFFNTTPNTLMAVGFFGGTGNLSDIPNGFYVAYQATTETFVGFIKNNGVVSTFNFLETIPAFNVQQYKKFSVRIKRLTLTDFLSGRGIFEITFGVDSIFRKTTLEYDKRGIFFGPGTLFTRENQGQSTGTTVNLQIDYADHIIYRPDRS